MQPQNSTLDKLFEGIKEYRVPLYQRLYVWNEYDQWAPLWEDITRIAGDLTSRGAGEIEPHFFGALVLKKSEGPTPDDANVYRVIDGQQRLTTMQLLLAAIVDEMKARKVDRRTVERLSDLIENPRFAGPDRRCKMRHGGNNYERFQDVMEAKGDLDCIRSLDGEMSKCYLYFRRAAGSWLDNDNIANRSDALATTMRTKLRVVAIYLDPKEPEHLIFETLNARGAALTEWDKIRNYLFYRVERDQDEFFRKYLERFDDTWWREKSGRGQDARPRTDRFVDYWLESRLHRPVERARVFRDFKAHTESRSDDDLLADVESLVNDADHYRKFESDSENGTDIESVFHHRRRLMGLGSFWPLIFGIRRIVLDDRQRNLVLSIIESWSVRRWVCGYYARNYPDLALDLLKQAASTGENTDVAHRIMDHPSWSGWWPNDEEVERSILDRKLSAQKVRLILEAIERHITPRHAGLQGIRYGDLQIEHLMPQGWKPPHWPPPAVPALPKTPTSSGTGRPVGVAKDSWESFKKAVSEGDETIIEKRMQTLNNHRRKNGKPDLTLDEARGYLTPVKPLPPPIAENSGAVERRENLIQTLGNLTFLVGSLNAQLSNGPWSEKREAIRKSDNLYLNKDLLQRAPDTWDEDAILERGRWMAKQICEIWPHAEGLRLAEGESQGE